MLASSDPGKLANLEAYLLDEVGPHFRRTGRISPEDFWLLLIWKANRAKNIERRRLEKIGQKPFDEVINEIAIDIKSASSHEERLRLLMKRWKMRLPIASAVLTVLYPEHFTVYDVRVCAQICGFGELAHRRFSTRTWEDYLRFVGAVREASPKGLTLRQMDRYLWGRSLLEQVRRDLAAAVPARRSRPKSELH